MTRVLREARTPRRSILLIAALVVVGLAIAAAVPTRTTAATGTLLVSATPDRAGAGELSGATIAGTAYVFFAPEIEVLRVHFELDGKHTWTEHVAPYDFAGGDVSTGSPWNTASVADGSHQITAVAVLPGGGTQSVGASFTVANTAATPTPTPTATAVPTATVTPAATATAAPSAPSSPSGGSLMVSPSADRSGGQALSGATVSGTAYVYLETSASVKRVVFGLDGSAVQTENFAPYDFRGGTSAAANPWKTDAVNDGSHTVTATVTLNGGGSYVLSALFTVANTSATLSSTDSVGEAATNDETSTAVSLLLSEVANRGAAIALDGATVSGDIYVFADVDPAPARVRFYIDPERNPLPVRTESAVAYDLGSTLPDGSARPFDASALEAGTHVVLAVAEYWDGSSAETSATFEVGNASLPDVDFALVVSETSNRAAPATLAGTDLVGEAFIFVTPETHVARVSFYLDDPARSSADRVDTGAPFDLVGGTASAAQPLDVDELDAGDHELAVLIERTDGTTVERTATFSVDGSILPSGAILIGTSDDAAAVVAEHPAGSTFVFESGIHRNVSIKPRGGDVFLGNPGAVLRGSHVLTGFAPTAGFWSVGGQTSELFATGTCEIYDDGSRYDACKYPEQLFVDGEPWWQVSSISQLGPGRWYFDYGADRVYIGANPSGRLVELATTAQAFKSSASGVTVSGLVIEQYANRTQTGAVDGSSATDWVVSDNVIRLNHGYGVKSGTRIQILNNVITYNGQLGLGGGGYDVLVAGNEIAYNHTGGFFDGWEAGAMKFSNTTRLVFRDNWVHHNNGRGIWTDINNDDVLILNNLVEWNYAAGIAHEISHSAEIRGNTSRYNGLGFSIWLWGAQILVQNSSDVLVIDNDVTVAAEGGDGITVVNQNRGEWVAERVTVTGNRITHLSAIGQDGVGGACQASQQNRFDGNQYTAPQNWFKWERFEWCGTVNWNEFRAAGHEATGTATYSD
jgi:hypothetical protein